MKFVTLSLFTVATFATPAGYAEAGNMMDQCQKMMNSKEKMSDEMMKKCHNMMNGDKKMDGMDMKGMKMEGGTHH